jgi:hypothetical protein
MGSKRKKKPTATDIAGMLKAAHKLIRREIAILAQSHKNYLNAMSMAEFKDAETFKQAAKAAQSRLSRLQKNLENLTGETPLERFIRFPSVNNPGKKPKVKKAKAIHGPTNRKPISSIYSGRSRANQPVSGGLVRPR